MKRVTTFLAAAITATAGVASAADTITVVSWGGAYTKSQIEAYHKPWIAETGNQVVSEDYNGGLAEIKAQVDAGNVKWDVVDVELSDAIRGCDEGLLETLDIADFPAGADGSAAAEDFLPGTYYDCAVANIVWSTIFAYDRTKVEVKGGGSADLAKAIAAMDLVNMTPIQALVALSDLKSSISSPALTISDFFDLEKYPGKRGIRKNPKANLEMALMADGVPAAEVYELLETEEGVERALAKLDTIKDSVVWWEAGAQPPQLLADGEVVMTTAYNGRIFNAVASEKKPFEIVWDGQVWDLDLFVIPKGAPNKDAAMDFVKFSTGTEPLAAQASWISYGPVRKSSSSLVGSFHDQPDLMMDVHMPTAPNNMTNALQNNFEFWADNQDQLNEQFNAWLAK